MVKQRRKWLTAALAALALGCATASPALAQYPDRPVKIVVPVAAGGGTDFTARVIAEKLGTALGQPVIVENRPGASGNVGVQAVATAAPDSPWRTPAPSPPVRRSTTCVVV